MLTRKHYLIIAIFIISILAISIILMPSSNEMALMEMKDKHFEEARSAYEDQLAKGNLSLEVVNHLTDLYLQVGAIDKAITTLQKFVEANPNHLEAREKLGKLYQYAQRNDDYLHNLEEINRIKPQTANLVALSSIYNFRGQNEKQAETLKKLVADDTEKNPKYYVDLANIQAARQDYPAAIATLRDMQKTFPDKFSFDNIALLVSLLLDNKQYDDALSSATNWVNTHKNDDESAELISLLHFQGNVSLGNKLLSHFTDQEIEANPELLNASILIQIEDGRENLAYQHLKALYSAQRLPRNLNGRLLILASRQGDTELTHSLLKTADLASFSETQIVALAELSEVQKDKVLLATLTDDFPLPVSAKNYPVLSAVLAVSNKRPDAQTYLSNLDSATLPTVEILQIANICSLFQNSTCVNHFLDKLPTIDKLTDADIATVSDIYLNTHQWDVGYVYIHKALETRDTFAIHVAAIHFAAARGNDKEVTDWLSAHGTALTEQMLADLYFIAMDNQQNTTALHIAQVYHDRHDTSLSRSLLANAYIKTGGYEMALTLLRNNTSRSEEDENNYITALVKLSPHNPAYRDELRSYASSKLNAGVSGNQKLILIYALIDAKQTDIAMPYIHELALKKGGGWTALYADLLDKQGKYDEARLFWLQVADHPYTTDTERKAIAFNLLDHGYKADAEKLLITVSKNYGPHSTEVNDVLYIMGPRPTDTEMHWMEDRYDQATNKDKAHWATLIDDYATPDYLIGFVNRHPETLNNPKIAGDFFQAELNKGSLASMENDYVTYATKYHSTALLKEYADAAEAGGLSKEAQTSYETIVAIDPTDYISLRQTGIIAYERADYSASSKYLGLYTKHYDVHPVADTEAYRAYFYYGEILRHREQLDKSILCYRKVLKLMNSDNVPQTADSIAIKAQSQVWSGDVKGGLATFDEARKIYPDNEDVHADYVSVLVDLGRYDEARKLIADRVQKTTSLSPSNATIPLFAGHVTGYTILHSNTELLIHFAEPTKDTVDTNIKTLPWVSYTSQGYDTLLIAAKPGFIFKANNTGSGSTVKAADISSVEVATDTQAEGTKSSAAMNIRYELLIARIDLETGHFYAATKRLNALLETNKNDPQLLGFTANAENYGGNWPQAAQLLKKAREIDPGNEDILALNRDIRREHAPNVTLDFEWVDYDKSFENITTLKGYTDVNTHVLVGGVIQDNYEIGKDLRLSNGRVGDISGNREQGEMYALYHTENGIRVQGSVFGNDDTAGAGGYFSFFNPLGDTAFTAEFHKPYWDLPEAVLDDANRDSVSFLHTIKPTTRLTLDGGLGLNRYNVTDIDDVTTSVTARIDAVYRLMEGQEGVRPYFDLGYGLDGEYIRTDKQSIDDSGSYTRVFPLFTREIHTIYGEAGYDFNDRTYGDVELGYEYDRYGGNGPLIEGKINHELNDAVDVQLRASYGLDSTSTESTVTRVGAYIRLRF